MDRDLELLDIQREQFYAGLSVDHTSHQQQMEEFELALGKLVLSSPERKTIQCHRLTQPLFPFLLPFSSFPFDG